MHKRHRQWAPGTSPDFIKKMREKAVFEFQGPVNNSPYFGGDDYVHPGQRLLARREQVFDHPAVKNGHLVEIPGADIRTANLDITGPINGLPKVSVRLTSKKGEKAGEVYDGCPIKLACALEEAGAVEIVDEAAGVPVPSH